MKTKLDFVTNSSSTAFIITNISDTRKSLVDFVEENPELIEEFKELYISGSWYTEEERNKYNQAALLESAKENNKFFNPQSSEYCVFGDEDGTLIGRVFDYILRDGGRSKSFKWRFDEYLR